MDAYKRHDAAPLKQGDLCCNHCYEHYVLPSKKIIEQLKKMAYKHAPNTNEKSLKNKKNAKKTKSKK